MVGPSPRTRQDSPQLDSVDLVRVPPLLIFVNLHPPFIFHPLLYLFDTCAGIGSVQMGESSIRNKGEMKMPPMATSGKLGHAGKRKHAHQLLKSEQWQRVCRDLLSLIENKWI